MIDRKNKLVQNILVNEDFINYVFNPTYSLTTKWDRFFRSHPEQISVANEARLILLGRKEKKVLPVNESLALKSRILEKCGFTQLN